MKHLIALAVLIGSAFSSSVDINLEYDHEQVKVVSISQAKPQLVIYSKELIAEILTIHNPTTRVLEETKDGEIDFNASADSIIQSIANQLFLGNGDPAELDSREITFEYKPLLITYTGTLQLTKGFIQDLSTVSRRADATITYNLVEGYMKVSIPISFKTIVAGYNFEMNVRGDTVTGVLYAWLDDVTADYNAQIALSTMNTIYTEFSLNIGSLDIDIYSSSISSSYKNLIEDLTADLMRETVLEQINVAVGDVLHRAVLSVIGIN